MSKSNIGDSFNVGDADSIPSDARRYGSKELEDIDEKDVDGDVATIKDWVVENKMWATLLVIGGAVAMMLLWHWLSPLIIALRNPVTFAILGFVVWTVAWFFAGRKSHAVAMSSRVTAVIQLAETAVHYEGEFDTDASGNPIVRPIKGYRLFGMVPVYLTYEDIDHRLTDQFGRTPDPEDRIHIRLKPDQTRVTRSNELGHVVVTQGHSLDGDYYADIPALTVTRPNLVDKDSYSKLDAAYRALRDTVRTKDKRIQNLLVDLERISTREMREEDDAIEKFVERYTKMREAEQPQMEGLMGAGDQPADRVRNRVDEQQNNNNSNNR